MRNEGLVMFNLIGDETKVKIALKLENNGIFQSKLPYRHLLSAHLMPNN
jgi:hypothetical protein